MSRPRARDIAILGLAIAAAWYFHGSIGYGLGWVDEGQTVYPSWEVAEGAVPHVSFRQMYGPSVFFLNGALLALFGPDLRVIRLFLLAVKVLVAVLVLALSSRVARLPVALAASAVVVAVWGMPAWFFNAPYASYYATALCLAALLVFTRGPTRGRAVLAGFLLGG